MRVWEFYCELREEYVRRCIKRHQEKTKGELTRQYEMAFYAITIVMIFYVVIIFMAIMGILSATFIEVVRALVA